jgi:nickel/cobalt transporter (NicO) family protein
VRIRYSMPEIILLLILTAVMTYVLPDTAFSQNSLGIGRPEQAIRPEGPFASALFWIQQQQQAFYKLLTGELQAMRTDGRHLWLLVGLSFAYGVFHAAGPGHGKAVISSYMIANEMAARRGIALAFASSFVQALTAILLISIVLLALRGSGIRQSDLTKWLEISSYAAISGLGVWLLIRKLRSGDHRHKSSHHSHSHGEGDPHSHDNCGHQHVPDPKQLTGKFNPGQAWTAIMAVGLRPCTGAIVVLTFSFLNGLFLAGVASTFAMALGTGLTVAFLAALAVWAKDFAISAGGMVDQSTRIHYWIEIGGAIMVLTLGLVLLSASLY